MDQQPQLPLEQTLYQVKKTIVGQDELLERMFVAPLARGHLLVEGVHFRRATTSARDLGHKALAVNLSDLAAMGAEPIAALVGLCLPPGGLSEADVDDLYAGMEALAERHGVTVAGGDVTCLAGLRAVVLGGDKPSPASCRRPTWSRARARAAGSRPNW